MNGTAEQWPAGLRQHVPQYMVVLRRRCPE